MEDFAQAYVNEMQGRKNPKSGKPYSPGYIDNALTAIKNWAEFNHKKFKRRINFKDSGKTPTLEVTLDAEFFVSFGMRRIPVIERKTMWKPVGSNLVLAADTEDFLSGVMSSRCFSPRVRVMNIVQCRCVDSPPKRAVFSLTVLRSPTNVRNVPNWSFTLAAVAFHSNPCCIDFSSASNHWHNSTSSTTVTYAQSFSITFSYAFTNERGECFFLIYSIRFGRSIPSLLDIIG